MTASPIRVLVADDEASVRETLIAVVRSDEALELVGAASDASEAVELARAHRPQVAVVDVKMPGGGGPRAAREILAACPGTRVVAFSAFDDRDAVLEMLRAGAVGYVIKGASVRDVLEGIHRAVRGEAALSPEVAAQMIHELAERLEREAREAEEADRKIERIRGVLDGRAELAVVFQPIFDLGHGHMVGAEALARFRCPPQRGPDAWFAEAALVGLGVELEVVAVRAAAGHAHRLPEDAYLSVNLSPEAVASGDLQAALAGVPAGRVVVEVTEHAPIGDYRSVDDALREFRSSGGRLAIDDAGAGFASLKHIVRLAPDIIKLDVSISRGIHANMTRRALAAALVSFAGEVGATIVAEGVETKEELETLRRLGVSQAQGNYLGPPAPPQELPAGGLPTETRENAS